MEFNVFRDYCKAENSEDEDIFNDLQSRLYAEIYYGTNEVISDENSSNKCVKSELDANGERECRQESNLTISKPPTLSTPALSYDNAALNRSKASHESSTEISPPNSSSTSIPKGNRPVEAENFHSVNESMKKDSSVNVKAEDGNSRSIPNEGGEENTEIVGVKKESNSILKKYEFSKPFINKLYREKYDNLTETLKLIQNVNDDENNRNERSECNESNAERCESKYKVTGKSGKKSSQQLEQEKEGEEIILTSDSDSEDSILEVPIPPKPQPPIINLHDSDIDSEDLEFDSGRITDETVNKKKSNLNECAGKSVEETTLNENRGGGGKGSSKNVKKSPRNAKKATAEKSEGSNSGNKVSSKNLKKGGGEKSMRNKSSTTTMDLMLNCTELQRSAGSLNEIRSMSKTLEGNVNYERDKNFAEDVMVANFVSPKSRKRKFDASTTSSVNEKRNEGENLLTEEESKNNDSKRLKSGESWQDYFFKPMSDNLKAFYNESRGQENFNVEEIQSKMSRDPRLWAILDEDLMPDLLKRHKYWNVRCNNCRQPGHQKINCPEPYKSIRCHICGGQGHIETRCPQKMCLTCGKKQGTFRKTCESCRSLYCNMCNAIGHKSTECPDLWRRFHQTTTQMNEINVPENLSEVMKPADLLYCCNCTKRGHDSSTCIEYRWSQHFPTPSFVSSYTSGPRYEIPPPPAAPSFAEETEKRRKTTVIHLDSNETSNKEDMIPLIKSQKKCMIFRPSASDRIESSRLVYSYGSFYTKLPNGEEIERKLAGEQVQLSHMTNLLKGSVSPIFLDELTKLSKFEIKIYYNSNNELMMRVRSKANLTRPIFELFAFWLKLTEEDKRLTIHVNLPRGSKTLLKLLATKLEDLQKDLQDPRLLSGQIKQLRRSLNFGENPERNRNKLLELQWSLMKVFHTKPKSNEHLQRLRKTIRCLKQMQRPEIILENYFSYIVVYNKVFLPRNLTETELQRFLKKYYRTFPEFDAPLTKKQKKVLLTPYEAFVTNLQQFNNNKNKNNNPTSAQSSNLIQVEIGENSSVTKNVEKTASAAISAATSTSMAESRQKSTLKIPQYVAKSTRDAEMEKTPKIASEHFQRPTLSIDNAGGKGQKSTQINIGIKIPEIGGQMNPNYSNYRDYGASGISVSSEISVQSVKRDDLQMAAIDERQKKKSSSRKEKSDEKTTNTENFDGILIGKATIVVNEALTLNAPYMNRAVDEVKKKMAEGMLKQEHVDTLQRLINLEKEHRNYVSSFCNYLQ